jgi:formylmethanofuran--tetrahydromethanopterin N-formyltransferase
MFMILRRRALSVSKKSRNSYDKIADTYSEAFPGLYIRLLITGERGISARDRSNPEIEYDELRLAAYRCTATPSVVVGRTEGGIERWLTKKQTPDGREGVIVQLWGMYKDGEDIAKQLDRFYKEMSIKIRQDVLSVTTTRVFSMSNPEERPNKNTVLDAEERIGKCGGGYEWFSSEKNAETINIPLMMGYDFKIDRYLPCGIGVSGGNLWLLCDSIETGRRAGRKALEAISQVEGVITPFYLCPSGSATEDYPPIGPPTNYTYCPTLREKLKEKSKVAPKVKSIPEIVIDGISLESVKKAMKAAVENVVEMDGVIQISAGNYEGKLGKYKIYLKQLLH